eukprot:4758039-Prymnesium_polylepis.1
MTTHGELSAATEAIVSKHRVEAWKERARAQLVPFINAALNGVRPKHVAFVCSACNGGHVHHTFCANNSKIKDRDRLVRDELSRMLLKVAKENEPQ